MENQDYEVSDSSENTKPMSPDSDNITVVRRVHRGVIDKDLINVPSNSDTNAPNVVNIILITIAICMLVGGIYFGFKWAQEEKKTADITQLWDDVKEIADETEDSFTDISWGEGYSKDPIDREINWDDLQTINSSVYAWIYIPNTSVDYPIMMEQKFGTYFYLNHDIYKQSLVSGCIFIPKEPDWFEGDDAHLLVFGHNMKNGTMFSSLMEYKDEAFYKEHPYIYVYYPDRTEKWAIWNAYHTVSDDIIYNLPYEYNTDNYRDLLSDMSTHSFYYTSVDSVDASQKVMTLSTCDKSSQSDSGRFVVNSVMTDVKVIE